jgi:hypothetical protein
MKLSFSGIGLCTMFGLAALAPFAADAQDRSERDQVCVYEHAGYGGWEQCFGVGDEIADMGDRRDQVSSIRIRGRAEITLYEHPSFQGNRVDVSSSVPDVRQWSRNWNDETDGLRVSRSGFRESRSNREQRGEDRVCVYQHANYQGKSQCWDAGDKIRDLSRVGWNDSISSIRTFGRTRVAFYEHSGAQGERLMVNGDVPDLSQVYLDDRSSWNDRISSVRIGG